MASFLVASRNARRFLPAAALLALLSVTVPAQAQTLTYTLSGVTFQDGGTASGSFVYNPTTDVFDTFNLTTTPGKTPVDGSIDTTGYNYTPGTAGTFTFGNTYYAFFGYQGLRLLTLDLSPGAKTPGTYTLVPGVSMGQNTYNRSYDGSTEYFTTATARTITAGTEIVNGAADPEPSEYAMASMFGTTLLVGIVKARRKKATRTA